MGACETIRIVSEAFTEECDSSFISYHRSLTPMLTWPTLPQQTQPGSVTVYPLNAFLVVKSDSNQWSQFFAWQWDSLGDTWCSSAHKPLPPSPILGARREQLYYVSPILLYSRAATTNALPVYLYTKYSISNLLLLLIQFKANLCPGWDPNPILQKCSCSCTTACGTAGQVKDKHLFTLCKSS